MISRVISCYIRGNIRSSDSACSCNLVEYTECPRCLPNVLSTTDSTNQARERLPQLQEISAVIKFYKIKKFAFARQIKTSKNKNNQQNF